MTPELKAALAENAEAIEQQIDFLLPKTDLPEAPLFEAMRYGTLGGGKRLRAFLVMETSQLFGVGRSSALRVAAAVEFVHAYSLIHDDLPAMDDGELRRGRPTVHREYDEATAVLAGDALLTYAFEILSDPNTHQDPAICCQLIAHLANAAGPHGMCGGQMLDLIGEGAEFDIGAITRLQRMKTGAMIAFSCEAGAILGRANRRHKLALNAYAHDIGLAFQIVDDLLDVEGREDVVGKSLNRDAERDKATFVSILGVDRARSQAAMLADQAIQHLDAFDDRVDLLKDVARFVVERRI